MRSLFVLCFLCFGFATVQSYGQDGGVIPDVPLTPNHGINAAINGTVEVLFNEFVLDQNGPSTGGPSTGGPSTGGTSTDGNTTGGTNTGGSNTDGTGTGGTSTGGTNTGGTTSTGVVPDLTLPTSPGVAAGINIAAEALVYQYLKWRFDD